MRVRFRKTGLVARQNEHYYYFMGLAREAGHIAWCGTASPSIEA
jgi:hypothetical protein